MNSDDPHRTDPTGAPSPFERQNVTESKGSAQQLIQWKHPAPALVVCVLHCEHASRRVVDVDRVDGIGDFRARKETAGSDNFDLDAKQRRSSSGFVEEDVRVLADQHRVPGVGRRCDGRLVAHRSRSDEEGRLFPGEFRRHLLQPVDGRILSVDVVSNFSRGHRFSHRPGRPGDGVAAQVDRLHDAGF
jgi:hypothetical protein